MKDGSPLARVPNWFGDRYRERAARDASYDLLETFIEGAHLDWSRAPATEKIAHDFSDHIAGMAREDLAFLLCHSGYIPETYSADSSQETLYSKLIEVLVGEWSKRIGFDKTVLPTRKSSVEDVTIFDGSKVIVCDTKSFRLGRSQKAPNVKDALKQGDILKWLGAYPVERRAGGIVTFPSQHDWTSGSDVYLYLTDKSSPIMLLYYEHLAFMHLNGCDKNRLLSYFERHPDLFPAAISKNQKNREKYFAIVHAEVVSCGDASWSDFEATAGYVIRERVSHAVARLTAYLMETRRVVEAEVHAMDNANLQSALVEAKVSLLSQNLLRQIANIKSFRATLD